MARRRRSRRTSLFQALKFEARMPKTIAKRSLCLRTNGPYHNAGRLFGGDVSSWLYELQEYELQLVTFMLGTS